MKLRLNSDRTVLLGNRHWDGTAPVEANALYEYETDHLAICTRITALFPPGRQREPATERAAPAKREGRSTRIPALDGAMKTVNAGELSAALLELLLAEMGGQNGT